ETAALGLAVIGNLLGLGWSIGLDPETELRLVEEARALGPRASDRGALVRVLASYAASRAFVGDLENYRTSIAEADRLERESPDRALRINVLLCTAQGHHWRADLRELTRVVDDALDLLREEPKAGGDIYMRSPVAQALMLRSLAAHYAGRLDEAVRDCERGAAEARAADAPDQESWLLPRAPGVQPLPGGRRPAVPPPPSAVW